MSYLNYDNLSPRDKLALAIQGEARDAAGQFAVASAIWNRASGNFGHFPGGSDPVAVATWPEQFDGFRVAKNNRVVPSAQAYAFADDILNRTLPNYGSTGNVVEFRGGPGHGAILGPGGNWFRANPKTGAAPILPVYGGKGGPTAATATPDKAQITKASGQKQSSGDQAQSQAQSQDQGGNKGKSQDQGGNDKAIPIKIVNAPQVGEDLANALQKNLSPAITTAGSDIKTGEEDLSRQLQSTTGQLTGTTLQVTGSQEKNIPDWLVRTILAIVGFILLWVALSSYKKEPVTKEA